MEGMFNLVAMGLYFIVYMVGVILYVRNTDSYVGTFELTMLTFVGILTAPIWIIVLGLLVLVGIAFLIATAIMHFRSRLTKRA